MMFYNIFLPFRAARECIIKKTSYLCTPIGTKCLVVTKF